MELLNEYFKIPQTGNRVYSCIIGGDSIYLFILQWQ